MKKCVKCKQEKPFSEFNKDKQKKSGFYSYCKECRNQFYQDNIESIKKREKQYALTPKGKYMQYKHRAKHRSIEFSLTFEEFYSYWEEPCDYCNTPIETIGLDRMDNSKGYTPENVISCCRSCNRKKGSKPLKEWKKLLA